MNTFWIATIDIGHEYINEIGLAIKYWIFYTEYNLCSIELPTAYSAHRQYVTIMIKADADDAIQQGVKPVGQEEYIYDSTKAIAFEGVRIAVRNDTDVEFASIKATKGKQKEYEEKFKTAYPEEIRIRDFLEFEDMTPKDLPRTERQKNLNH